MPRSKSSKIMTKENLTEGTRLRSPRGSVYEILLVRPDGKSYEIGFVKGELIIASSCNWTADVIKDHEIIRHGKTKRWLSWADQKAAAIIRC